MKTFVLSHSQISGGVRLDFAYNLQLQQNRRLTGSQHEWRRLSDLTLDISDGPRRVESAPAGVPYIRIGDLNAGDVSSIEGTFVAEQGLKPRFRLEPNDVLLSKTSDQPRAAMVTDRLVGATFSPDIFRLRIDPERISPAWVALFFNTHYAARVFSQQSYGARVKRLLVTDLRYLRIPVPSQELVREVEALEQQAQEYSAAARSTLLAVTAGLYSEISTRLGGDPLSHGQKYLQVKNNRLHYRWDMPYVRNRSLVEPLRRSGIFEPVTKLAHLAVASRTHLDPEQQVCFVNVSDIDTYYLTFSQTHQARVSDLSNRLRLPLQADQVLVLASGSNLGSEDHPVAVVEPELDGCLTSTAFIALDFPETPLYFGLVMRHPLVLAQLRSLASGSVVQQTLNKQELKSLLLPVLGGIWRQDYNDRARIAWEKRRLAICLRQQAIDKVEAFISEAMEM